MKKMSNKGFTLVELIIVIAILAIIMLIAIPNFSGIQQRMQVRADKATAAQIGKAVRVWFTDYTTDENMLASTKATTDHADGNTTAPVAKEVTVNSTDYEYVALPYVASDSATPINYEKLVTIDEYITRGQKPTSLKPSNVQDADQFYGIYLTSDGASTSAKICVAIVSTTEGQTSVAHADGATDSYDGTTAGIAYIEP